MSNNSNNTMGLLAGVAVGALLGVLYAPNKGSKTRKIIKEKALDAKDQIADEAIALKDKVVDETLSIKDTVTDTIDTRKKSLDENLNIIVSNISYEADDLISALEQKLELLKAKNKQIQKKL